MSGDMRELFQELSDAAAPFERVLATHQVIAQLHAALNSVIGRWYCDNRLWEERDDRTQDRKSSP